MRRSLVDGRWLVVGAAVACLVVLAVARAFGAPRPFTWLGVNQLSPAFFDLHNATSAADCAKKGFDPLVEDPCDAERRPLNYPRAWLLLVPSGWDGRARVVLGTGMALAVLGGFLAFLGRLRPREGVLAALLAVSPALLLLYERGNVDGWVFLLCLAAAPLLASAREWRRDAGVALVSLAAVMKLFPAVILPALLVLHRRDPRTHARVAVAAGLLASYAWWTRGDIAMILRTVPRSAIHSYGANTVALRLGSGADLRPWFLAAAAIVFVAAAVIARVQPRLPALDEGRAGVAFVGGAAVYVGTFAAGVNWAYRLVFLLMLVPQLVAWGREEGSARSLSRAIWPLALLPAYCSLVPLPGQSYVPRDSLAIAGISDVASWALALLLVGLLGARAGSRPCDGPVRPRVVGVGILGSGTGRSR